MEKFEKAIINWFDQTEMGMSFGTTPNGEITMEDHKEAVSYYERQVKDLNFYIKSMKQSQRNEHDDIKERLEKMTKDSENSKGENDRLKEQVYYLKKVI
jgi:uncharacterized membrane protein